MPDAAPPPPRHPFRWLLVAVGVLALPVVIILATRAVFRHVVQPPDDSPATRKLQDISHALHRYAHAHDGGYPGSLAALARDQHLPDDLATVPTTAPGGPYEFVYLGAGLADQTAANGRVLAYDPPAANGGRGSHVLYADGTDAWVPADELQTELDHSNPPPPPPE